MGVCGRSSVQVPWTGRRGLGFRALSLVNRSCDPLKEQRILKKTGREGFGALLFTSSVAAGKLLQLSDPLSPHL